MPLIIIITIAVYIILIAWTWHNLDNISKFQKIACIFAGIIVIYLITLIVFIFSTNGLEYENTDTKQVIKNVIVIVFTGINGIIILPYISKTWMKFLNEEIKKEKFLKRIGIIIMIFTIFIIFECGYMKDTQEGILKRYDILNNQII